METTSVGSGGSTVVSKEELVVEQFEGCDESELELGLGLGLGLCSKSSNVKIPRILTAKDLASLSCNSSVSSCSSLGLRTPTNVSANSSSNVNANNNNNNNSNSNVSCKNGGSSNGNNVSAGTKRAASPTGASQVVGWPPIRQYRMNSMVNQAKSIATGEHSSQFDEAKEKDAFFGTDDKVNAVPKDRVPLKSSLFVKVNMDGVAIGRKVDLSGHSSYESLARTLEEMFINKAVEKSSGSELVLMPKVTRPSKLLDGSSEYVLTYEDKDGDWMLVGDVPWGMFLSSVKRLRIMRTSEANGLAPRLEERSAKQRSRPI